MIMADGQRKRLVFLYSMALVYMFAFVSWFIQIPGLYGDDGLLPVRNEMANMENKSIEKLFAEKPTIVWVFLYFGLNYQTSLELLCLLGTTISFFCLLSRRLRCLPVFATLWFFYFSLFQVGQTFSWFQWDTLLLEAGFLTILVAPLTPRKSNDSMHDDLAFFLVRWLLFRLMFASGVVKLLSGCQTWWGLTALNYHFETQCIPTPLAWWAHQLPNWILRLCVVGTYLIEIALPFLFFAPVRKLNLISVYGQVLLMTTIMLTGNYNFFNILTVVLCISAVDDEHIAFITRKTVKTTIRRQSTGFLQKVQKYSSLCITITVCCLYSYYLIKFFGLKLFEKGDPIHSEIAFSKAEFTKWTDEWTVNAISIAVIYFICIAMSTLYKCLRKGAALQRGWNIIKYFIMLCICIYMFCISMVPLNTVTSTRKSWSIIQQWHSYTQKYELVHSYGLFRSMTGVGGRPEVILEGSFTESGPWKEIPFRNKPGNTTISTPWIAPHQPRLDWQMWFAALGQYQHNIWLVNLVNKLFIGQSDVLSLLDAGSYPFKDKAPNYIRANLYLYHFTLLRKDGGIPKRVWTRKFSRSYLPTIHKTDEAFEKFLKYHNLISKKSKRHQESGVVEETISFIRNYLELIPIPMLSWSLWLTAILISSTKKLIAD